MADYLEAVLQGCSVGDLVECVSTAIPNCKCFTKGKLYTVEEDSQGVLYILDDNDMQMAYDTLATFSIVSSNTQATESDDKKDKPRSIVDGDYSPSAPWEEAHISGWRPYKPSKSNDKKDKPRSIVDGDYSQYCTWDVEESETKTSEWKPDTIREDIDIMESIRHACNRI